ncbi:MAG TPA: glycogen-binding domain-containing protein [Gemmatimonadaceae bacterium]|nr:glycogen-binding domain-containing protein [Gemmatimonadaceae bacterium]
MGAGTAEAQFRAEAEVGGARVTQAPLGAVTAATLQGTGAFTHSWLTVHGSSAVTMPASEEARVHGLFAAAARTSPARRLTGDVTVLGSVYNDGVFPAAYASQLRGGVRARTRLGAAWVGAGIGTLDDGVHEYPLTQLDAGMASTWRRLGLSVTGAHHVTLGEPRLELPERDTIAVSVRDRIRYTDAVLTPRMEWRRVELEARGGMRFIHRTIAFEERRLRAFGSIGATWWVTPEVAVVGALGRDLADLTQGLPDSRYLTFAVRARLRSAARSPVAVAPPSRRVQGAAPDVLLERAAAGGAQLRVLTAAGARQVEVAATFTEWEAVLLAPDGDGAWTLDTPVPSGPHRLIVRVDGGAWTPPANLPSLVDEDLGAAAGIVTVP